MALLQPLGYLLGVWTEHLQQQRGKFRKKDTPDIKNWKKVMDLIQMELRDVQLVEEDTWKVVVFIPKRGGNFWGVGILKFLWKMVAVILNRHIGAYITLNNFLNRLQSGVRVETECLRDQMIHQLKAKK